MYAIMLCIGTYCHLLSETPCQNEELYWHILFCMSIFTVFGLEKTDRPNTSTGL